MGRGSSKAGGGSAGGAAGTASSGTATGAGVRMTSANAMSLLNMVKNQFRNSGAAVDTIRNLIDSAVIGTKIELKSTSGWIETYVKKTANKWAVSMGLKGEKPKKSTQVASATAKQIAVTLFDLD